MKNKTKFFATLLLLIIVFSQTSCKKTVGKGIDEKIYVANEEEGTITIFEANSYKELKKVDLTFKGEMYMAHNVQTAPNGKMIVVTGGPHSNGGDEYVMVISGNRDKIKERINVGNEQHLAHVVIDDDSKYAYVSATQTGQIIVIDLRIFQEIRRFDLGSNTGPHGLRYMNYNLYVACTKSNELLELNVITGKINRINVGGVAVQTAVLKNNNEVYVSVYDLKQVVKYDLNSGDTTIIQLPNEAQGPIQIYPSPDNKYVYVCDQGILNERPISNKLFVIETATNKIIETVNVGQGSHGVCTNADGSKIFVTNIYDNTVSVIDATNYTILQTVNVGVTPNGISSLKCD